MCVRRITTIALGVLTTVPVMALAYPDALWDAEDASERVVAVLGLALSVVVLTATAVGQVAAGALVSASAVSLHCAHGR